MDFDTVQNFIIKRMIYKCSLFLNSTARTYPEAEQCLVKADKVSEERAKLTSTVGSEQEQMAIYIAIAMGKYVKLI